MTDQQQIPIEEALKLVEFELVEGEWRVRHVKCDVDGSVWCNVHGDVDGSVLGSVIGNVWHVQGDVLCHVSGHVRGTISGRTWEFVETPKEKLKRLIEEGADKAQLLEAFNQLQENN